MASIRSRLLFICCLVLCCVHYNTGSSFNGVMHVQFTDCDCNKIRHFTTDNVSVYFYNKVNLTLEDKTTQTREKDSVIEKELRIYNGNKYVLVVSGFYSLDMYGLDAPVHNFLFCIEYNTSPFNDTSEIISQSTPSFFFHKINTMIYNKTEVAKNLTCSLYVDFNKQDNLHGYIHIKGNICYSYSSIYKVDIERSDREMACDIYLGVVKPQNISEPMSLIRFYTLSTKH